MRRILPALFAACILSVTQSSADVPPSLQIITDDTPVPVEAAAIGICTVEPAPPGGPSYSFGSGRWRDFVWRIHPDACEACPFPQALAMESVAFRVRWLGKCDAQVELTIIGATGPAACPQPDTTNVLCGPSLHPISSDAFAGLKTHTLPIPGSCCISQDAFVRVRFVSLLCDDVSVTDFGIASTLLPCTNCEQYFGTTSFWTLSDWCSAFNGAVPTLWTRYTANCCAPVPTVPRSWGQVKTLYGRSSRPEQIQSRSRMRSLLRFSRSAWLVLALIAVVRLPAHAGGYLWLGAEYQVEGNAYRFNLQTRSVDKVISPTATDHWNNMATDGLNMYLSNPANSVLNKHDAYSGALVTPGAYAPTLAGHKEDGAFADGSLWRITYSGNVLHRTTTAGVVETTFTIPTGFVGIEWVGTTLFVSDYSNLRIGRLARIDATTWSYTAYPWKGTPPTGNLGAIAWDKQADSLYLATQSGLLYTIKVENDSARALLSANLVAAGYPSGGLPDGMGWVLAPAPTGVVPGEAGAATFTLGEPTPNPARAGVRFELSSDRTTPADIGIYDATGRRLRGWTLPALSPGRSSFMWDFHDSRGSVVPPGVYFVRVRSGLKTLSRRFTRVE